MNLHTTLLKRIIKNISRAEVCSDWEIFAISLFWSMPNITQNEWLEKLLDHETATGMLENTLTYVNIGSVFNFFPMELFYASWPNMRLYCPERLFKERSLYDFAWSILATATKFVPPLMTWFDLSDEEKHIVAYVSRYMAAIPIPYESIYQKLIETGFLQCYKGRIFTGNVHRTLRIRWPKKRITYKVNKHPERVFYSYRDMHI